MGFRHTLFQHKSLHQCPIPFIIFSFWKIFMYIFLHYGLQILLQRGFLYYLSAPSAPSGWIPFFTTVIAHRYPIYQPLQVACFPLKSSSYLFSIISGHSLFHHYVSWYPTYESYHSVSVSLPLTTECICTMVSLPSYLSILGHRLLPNFGYCGQCCKEQNCVCVFSSFCFWALVVYFKWYCGVKWKLVRNLLVVLHTGWTSWHSYHHWRRVPFSLYSH